MVTGEFGFIGLGNIGDPVAHRLLDEGHALIVHDIRQEAVDRLVARGAQPASSPEDVANRTETLFLSLPTPPIVEAVARGEGGLISGDTVKRVVDLSTTGPDMAASLCDTFQERAIRWIDCPVSGGVAGARAGTLAVMCSGPRSDFDDLLPLFQIIGKPFYIGDRPGLAQTMKLVNNQLSAGAMALTCEAAVMGAKAGIDPQVMIDVINAGSGCSTASLQKFPRSILPRTFDYGFSTGLMHKDVELFNREADAMGLALPACRIVLEVWQRAVEDLGPDSDFTQLITLMEKDAGFELGDKTRS